MTSDPAGPPDEAIQAAALALLHQFPGGCAVGIDIHDATRAVLAAVWPVVVQAIRATIADEIRAIPLRYPRTFGPKDGFKSGPAMRDEAETVARGVSS